MRKTVRDKWPKREYLVIGIVILLFISVSYLSLTSIHQLRGNARVVNYVGIVRGATQKLIKKELRGYQDDALIHRLDSIINELISGEGPNNLIVLPDQTYLDNMNQVKRSWMAIRAEIALVRAGSDGQRLFDLSEDYFVLVDKTVSASESFSERQVKRSTDMLVGVNVLFVLLIAVGIVYFIRSAALKRRADLLNMIAYVDPLTQMNNRASAEREIDRYTKFAPKEPLAVFMFDMNNLKLANDLLGHQGGDRIIADFARIVKTEGEEFGFTARYGGDEFLAIFPGGDETIAETYLTRINERVVAYNVLHVSQFEKISFAAGYVIDKLQNTSLLQLINEADRRMYVRKRQMKENRD